MDSIVVQTTNKFTSFKENKDKFSKPRQLICLQDVKQNIRTSFKLNAKMRVNTKAWKITIMRGDKIVENWNHEMVSTNNSENLETQSLMCFVSYNMWFVLADIKFLCIGQEVNGFFNCQFNLIRASKFKYFFGLKLKKRNIQRYDILSSKTYHHHIVHLETALRKLYQDHFHNH